MLENKNSVCRREGEYTMQTSEYTKTNTLTTELTDGILVQQTLAGQQEAFELLVRRYQTPLFNYVCHCLGNYDLACDVTQHVFVQLYTSLSTLRTNAPLKSWLFQVAHNRCLDELRRKHISHFSELESTNADDDLSPLDILPDNNPLPEELAEHRELQQALHQAIDTLPPKYRAVVLLRYTAQLSFSEVGEILDTPEHTAK